MFCRCIIISESVTTLLCNEWKMLQGWSGAILGRGIWPLFPSHCLALMEGSWRPEIYYLRQCLGVWEGAWAQQMHKGKLNKLIPFGLWLVPYATIIFLEPTWMFWARARWKKKIPFCRAYWKKQERSILIWRQEGDERTPYPSPPPDIPLRPSPLERGFLLVSGVSVRDKKWRVVFLMCWTFVLNLCLRTEQNDSMTVISQFV